MVARSNGGFNQVLYWSRLLDWKNQTLTPNPDVIYLMPFFNTKDVGPVVLEIPPADDGLFNGSVMNYWQAAIEDVGPGGVDKGKGGKYLFLPPGYDTAKAARRLHRDAVGHLPGLRAAAVGAEERQRCGRREGRHVCQAPQGCIRCRRRPIRRATTFVDASGIVFDSTIRYDLSFFESLERRWCRPSPGSSATRR